MKKTAFLILIVAFIILALNGCVSFGEQDWSQVRADLEVTSTYITHHQVIQQVREYIPGNIGARHAGSFGGGTSTPASPGRIVTREKIVNVPTRHELWFEIWEGNIRIFSGITPARITGLNTNTEYILLWSSPTAGGIVQRPFTIGPSSIDSLFGSRLVTAVVGRQQIW